MFRVLAILAVFFVLPVQATLAAAEGRDSRRAAAERLLESSSFYNQDFRPVLEAAVEMAMRLLRQEKADLPDNMDRIISILLEEADIILPELLEELAAVQVTLYAKYFSESEINNMADFNESPVGRKISASAPPLLLDLIEAAPLFLEMSKKKNVSFPECGVFESARCAAFGRLIEAFIDRARSVGAFSDQENQSASDQENQSAIQHITRIIGPFVARRFSEREIDEMTARVSKSPVFLKYLAVSQPMQEEAEALLAARMDDFVKNSKSWKRLKNRLAAEGFDTSFLDEF